MGRLKSRWIWCPVCGEPVMSFVWGALRKQIAARHGVPKCTGSFQWGRELTPAEVKAHTERPSPSTLRALAILAEGPRTARDFAETMWPEGAHDRVTAIGRSRGGRVSGAAMVRTAASSLARLVRQGLAVRHEVGAGSATRCTWSLSDRGRAMHQRYGETRDGEA